MNKYIVIESIASVSALGSNEGDQLKSLLGGKCFFETKTIREIKYPVIPIHPEAELELKELLHQFPKYKRLDRTAQLAILTASKCFEKMQKSENHEWVINAGSSRGATGVWEKCHEEFVKEQDVPIKSSPLTTLGNISTCIAQHQKLQGFQIDHSITCSSGLQALANAFAWLKSGLTNYFLAVGTEAPLTEFTLAQMVALGIYTKEKDQFPCKPCLKNDSKSNTFTLGEGAVAIALINKEKPEPGSIYLAGMGTASETITNPTSISPDGDAFRLSMSKAIKYVNLNPEDIDVVIPHSPGTYQGDQAEYVAIQKVFGEHQLKIINHKFLIGHTLGASGLLSLHLGYFLMTGNLELDFPYPSIYPTVKINHPKTILINSMGFGGNAVSIILKKSDT